MSSGYAHCCHRGVLLGCLWATCCHIKTNTIFFYATIFKQLLIGVLTLVKLALAILTILLSQFLL